MDTTLGVIGVSGSDVKMGVAPMLLLRLCSSKTWRPRESNISRDADVGATNGHAATTGVAAIITARAQTPVGCCRCVLVRSDSLGRRVGRCGGV